MNKMLIAYTSIGLVVFSILGIGLWLFYPSDKSPYPSVLISAKDKLQYEAAKGSSDFKNTVITIKPNEKKENIPQSSRDLVEKESKFDEEISQKKDLISESDLISDNNLKKNDKNSQVNVFKNLKKTEFKNLPKPDPKIKREPKPEIISTLKKQKHKIVEKKSNKHIQDYAYWIQVASLSNKAHIEKLKKYIDKNTGKEGTIFKISSESKTLYRLRYGPYSEKADISTLNEKIKNLTNIKTIVYENKF